MMEDHSQYLKRLTLLQKPMKDVVLKEAMDRIWQEVLPTEVLQEAIMKRGIDALESGDIFEESAMLELFKEVIRALTPIIHFEEFTEHYRPLLYALAMQILGNHHSAEEVVQESLLKAYIAMKSYSVKQLQTLRFRPWLCRIVRNTANNYRDREIRLVHLDLSEGSAFLEIEGNTFENPETAIIANETAYEFGELIRRLPQKYRAIILLRFREELDYKDIAEALNYQSIGTLKSHMHISLHLMRKIAKDIDIQKRDFEI